MSVASAVHDDALKKYEIDKRSETAIEVAEVNAGATINAAQIAAAESAAPSQ